MIVGHDGELCIVAVTRVAAEIGADPGTVEIQNGDQSHVLSFVRVREEHLVFKDAVFEGLPKKLILKEFYSMDDLPKVTTDSMASAVSRLPGGGAVVLAPPIVAPGPLRPRMKPPVARGSERDLDGDDDEWNGPDDQLIAQVEVAMKQLC